VDIEPIKPRFYDLINMYNLDYIDLEEIAKKAKVDKSILENMFLQIAVSREDAIKVLAMFSEHVNKKWIIDDVRVALCD
jgi:hypothetical protein